MLALLLEPSLFWGLVYIYDVAKDESIVRQCISVERTLTEDDQELRYNWLGINLCHPDLFGKRSETDVIHILIVNVIGGDKKPR